MAKPHSSTGSPVPTPTARLRGGEENWRIFQVIDSRLKQVGLEPGDQAPPGLPIHTATWQNWLRGSALSNAELDGLAVFLSQLSDATCGEGDGLRQIVSDLYAAKTGVVPDPGRRFQEVLRPHLAALGWDQRMLAERWVYSGGLVSGFFSGTRSLQIEHINKLAIILTQEYEQLTPEKGSVSEAAKYRYGFRAHHQLLDELLAAAGFAVFAGGREPNRVWKRLHRTTERDTRVLRVGKFPWPPLFHTEESGDRGLARDIVEIVGSLLAVRIVWVPVRWPDVHSQLLSGDVDLIAPILLRLPVRMLDLAMSKALPHLRCIPNGLLSRAAWPDVLTQEAKSHYRDGKLKQDAITRDHIDGSKLVWVVGKSEVTVQLARLIDSSAELDDRDEFSHITDGWRSVLAEPFDKRGRVRVFPTEQVTAAFATTRLHDERAATLFPERTSSEIGLGIGFAAHAGEPKLIEVINACIDEIGRRPSYVERLYRPYLPLFLAANALPDDVWRNPNGTLFRGKT